MPVPALSGLYAYIPRLANDARRPQVTPDRRFRMTLSGYAAAAKALPADRIAFNHFSTQHAAHMHSTYWVAVYAQAAGVALGALCSATPPSDLSSHALAVPLTAAIKRCIYQCEQGVEIKK